MANDTRQLPASNDGLYRFLGGSPLAVAFRLILLSILVGVVLAAIGFDPCGLYVRYETLTAHGPYRRLVGRVRAVDLHPCCARRRVGGDGRLRTDLDDRCRQGGCDDPRGSPKTRPDQSRRSMMVALDWPPPSHMVWKP